MLAVAQPYAEGDRVAGRAATLVYVFPSQRSRRHASQTGGGRRGMRGSVRLLRGLLPAKKKIQ